MRIVGTIVVHPVGCLVLTVVVGGGAILLVYRDAVKREYDRAGMVVRPFEVPEHLAKRGYTGTVVVEQLLDEIQAIREAQSQRSQHAYTSPVDSRGAAFLNYLQSEIGHHSLTIPTINTDLLVLMRFFRNMLGDEIVVLTGEVTCDVKQDCSPEEVQMHLRVLRTNAKDLASIQPGASDSRRHAIKPLGVETDLKGRLKAQAMGVLEEISPTDFAMEIYSNKDALVNSRDRAKNAVFRAANDEWSQLTKTQRTQSFPMVASFALKLRIQHFSKEALPFIEAAYKKIMKIQE